MHESALVYNMAQRFAAFHEENSFLRRWQTTCNTVKLERNCKRWKELSGARKFQLSKYYF